MESKIGIFEKYAEDYEKWFERHGRLYRAELEAVRSLMPPFQKGVEIGVGSGRFAAPLGIQTGVEPSSRMAEIARRRGVDVIVGVAEKLPFDDGSFDMALMVTTICFVDDPPKSLREIWRILKPGGYIVVGFVDRKSELGKFYERNREKSRFYKEATFFSAEEVLVLLREAGFSDCEIRQTLFGPDLDHMQTGVKPGYGEGAFVVIRCRKSDAQA
ncbi:class I SAM-dependent methyltransferase [Hydrogenimonas urashimensis]|uniref:class I SAM-dependent methyltransferase n=1 Tax=Hydrogenimonas urashimensis TaxID=2740515 RepID=UPI00191636B3|nr:class I SAM-dependent methyltransferase [Hydrogenimonas urashimensis]